jgi:hypothetical protein
MSDPRGGRSLGGRRNRHVERRPVGVGDGRESPESSAEQEGDGRETEAARRERHRRRGTDCLRDEPADQRAEWECRARRGALHRRDATEQIGREDGLVQCRGEHATRAGRYPRESEQDDGQCRGGYEDGGEPARRRQRVTDETDPAVGDRLGGRAEQGTEESADAERAEQESVVQRSAE